MIGPDAAADFADHVCEFGHLRVGLWPLSTVRLWGYDFAVSQDATPIKVSFTFYPQHPVSKVSVSTANFTPKAELLWSTVRPDAKAGILKSVWCAKCRAAVEIVDYKGCEKNGNVVLDGKCKICGGRVRRVVETAEAPIPPN